eukprot:8672690-Pyramimonas_sp.AAC.2
MAPAPTGEPRPWLPAKEHLSSVSPPELERAADAASPAPSSPGGIGECCRRSAPPNLGGGGEGQYSILLRGSEEEH